MHISDKLKHEATQQVTEAIHRPRPMSHPVPPIFLHEWEPIDTLTDPAGYRYAIWWELDELAKRHILRTRERVFKSLVAVRVSYAEYAGRTLGPIFGEAQWATIINSLPPLDDLEQDLIDDLMTPWVDSAMDIYDKFAAQVSQQESFELPYDLDVHTGAPSRL